MNVRQKWSLEFEVCGSCVKFQKWQAMPISNAKCRRQLLSYLAMFRSRRTKWIDILEDVALNELSKVLIHNILQKTLWSSRLISLVVFSIFTSTAVLPNNHTNYFFLAANHFFVFGFLNLVKVNWAFSKLPTGKVFRGKRCHYDQILRVSTTIRSCELNRSAWKQRLLSSSSVVFCQFWDTFEYLLLFRLAYPYRAKTRQSREKKYWGPFRSSRNTGYLWEKLEGGGIVLSDKYGGPSNTLQMIFEKLS